MSTYVRVRRVDELRETRRPVFEHREYFPGPIARTPGADRRLFTRISPLTPPGRIHRRRGLPGGETPVTDTR